MTVFDPELYEQRVEVAFDGTWYDDPDALTWTDVTGQVKASPPIEVDRGREPSQDRTPQTGRMSLTVAHGDGSLLPVNASSPHYPNVQPGLPIRLLVKDAAGTWWPVFYGFVSVLAPRVRVTRGDDGSETTWTEVDVRAVDGWARVMQAGKRVTYRDRVYIDLAGGRDLAWFTGQDVEGRRGNGATATIVAQDLQAFGFWWGALTAAGIAWDVPTAACVLSETGGGDNSRQYPFKQATFFRYGNRGGMVSDRFGGVWGPGPAGTSLQQAPSWGIDRTPGEGPEVNSVRCQVSVGRPPAQLLPAACLTADGWTSTAGAVSDVAASSEAWTAKSEDFDPATGVRTGRVDGPDRVIVWATSSGADYLRSDPFPMTAGQVLVAHVAVDHGKPGATATRLTVEWLNSGGTVISAPTEVSGTVTGPEILESPTGIGAALWTAPTGTVSARLRLRSPGSAIRLQAGAYEGLLAQAVTDDGPLYLPPGRWWGVGESDHLLLSIQAPLIDPAAIGVTAEPGQRLWLHGTVEVDSWADGEPHSVVWNLHPGVDGQPVLWVDGALADVAWRLSDPHVLNGWNQGTTLVEVIPGTTFGQANGSRDRGISDAPFTANPSSPSTVTTLLGYSGSDRWNATPNDGLVERWHRPYGAPATVQMVGTVSGTADVLVDSLLDALAWPASQRDLDTGTISTSVTWTDGADLGDYPSKISDLAAAEYGWAGVDGSGALVWRPMGWYDPDGDGTAVAKAHLTYKTGLAGKFTYQVGLGQAMSEDKVVNQVQVSGFGDTLTALAEDRDSQQRIGIRRQELTNNAWQQDDVDAVAAEVLALYGRPTLVPDKVTLQATGPDDPMLAVILGLNPADVVLVDIPRAPAADLTVSALVGQVSLTSDGRTLTAELTLGPCPVTATTPPWTGPIFVGLDADGPYFDPDRAEAGQRVSLITI